MGEIAGVIGPEGAGKLARARGGTRFYVPRRPGAQHQMANLLGIEQARRLGKAFGGKSLYIPRNAAGCIRDRNREIVRRYDGGASVRALALAFDLTERQIYAILGQSW